MMSCGYSVMRNMRLKGMPRPVVRELDQELLLLGALAGVLDRRTSALVGPTRYGLPKVRGKNGVRDFVRQHGIENSLSGSLNRHRPTKGTAAIEHETRRSAGAQLRSVLDFDRTRLRPRRQLFTQPFDGQIRSIALGRLGHLSSEVRMTRGDNEVLRADSGRHQ